MNIEYIKDYLRPISKNGILLAFSGGTDSALLLALLVAIYKEEPFNFVVATADSLLQSRIEIDLCLKLAKEYGVKHLVFPFDSLAVPEVKNNSKDRCYHCKKQIFSMFLKYANTNNLACIFDGTNHDDLNVYRPGRKALFELGIRSPFAELKITKTLIREFSRELGLSTAEKPATPCLATRFSYGTVLDMDSILRVDKGEREIRKYLPDEADLRLRIENALSQEAKIEVSCKYIPIVQDHFQEITKALLNLGYSYVSIDPLGFCSGKMDSFAKNNTKSM